MSKLSSNSKWPELVPLTTIVVPTFNEADNVLALVERVRRVLNGRPAEMLFVDDSTDLETLKAIDLAGGLFSTASLKIRSYHRTGEDRWGGLSGAVSDGIANALADQVIIMDGDLQHPPETLPSLIATAEGANGQDTKDIVIASRYCVGGKADGLDGSLRRLVSHGSTALAKGFFPKRLQGVTDPMTGFFLVNRQALDLSKLRPKGFKILLEILARHADLRVAEVPFVFAERGAGESKGDLRQGMQFLSQLATLRKTNNTDAFCALPKILQFGLIGGSVFAIGMAMLFVLVEVAGLTPLQANAIQLAVTFALNYQLNVTLTWRERTVSRLSSLKFVASRGATTILNYYLFAWLVTLQFSYTVASQTNTVTIHYLSANVLALGVIMVLNYFISDLWAFADAREAVDRKKAAATSTQNVALDYSAETVTTLLPSTIIVPELIAPAKLVAETVTAPGLASVSLAVAAAVANEMPIRTTPTLRKDVKPRSRRFGRSGQRSMIVAVAWATIAGGLIAWGIRTDVGLTVSIVLALAGLLMFAQSAFEVWRVMYAYREPEAVERMRFPEALENPSERFCLIVPARHEDAVLADTLRLLSRQTHPNVHIISVMCDDDYDTIQVARQVADENERVEVMLYPLLPGTKPNKPSQMNYVLESVKDRGYTVVGVFDAEDSVQPELMMHVDAAFQDKAIDIVQGGAQLMNHDSSWFAIHNVLEYYKWQSSGFAFHAANEFMPLGGNTVFIRFELLQKAGGWPTTLTEDCSLGVLLSTRYNTKTATYYEPHLATQEETPDTLTSLFRQRVRWCQGFYHEWRKGVWRELPTIKQRMLASYVLLSPVLLAISTIMLSASLLAAAYLDAPVGLVMLMYIPLVPMLLLLALNAIFLYDFGKAFDRKVRIHSYAVLFTTYFLYQLVLNAAALWSIIRELRGDSSWQKTAHSGLHRRDAFASAVNVAVPATATVIANNEK